MAFRGKVVLEAGRKGRPSPQETKAQNAVICQGTWQTKQAPISNPTKLSSVRLNPKGTNPIAVLVRNNCLWMNHYNHCTWVLVLQSTDPISNFITSVLPQNFPLVSAAPFLTFGCCAKFFSYSVTPYLRCKPQPQCGPTVKIYQENIWQTCFLYLPPAITSKVYHILRRDSIHFLKPSLLSLFRKSCISPLAFCFLGQYSSAQVT